MLIRPGTSIQPPDLTLANATPAKKHVEAFPARRSLHAMVAGG